MNLLTRAFSYLARNLGKALAMWLIVFALVCAISGAVSTRQAIENADTNLRITLPAIASIEICEGTTNEYVSLTGQWPEIQSLTVETLAEIGALSYVRNYDISARAFLDASYLELVSLSEDMGFGDSGADMPSTVNLKGVYGANLLDAEEGVIEVVQGRTFTEPEVRGFTYVALISQSLAEINGLGIGSTFTLDNTVWKEDAWETQDFSQANKFAHRSYDFEVVGIFVPTVEINTGDEWMDRHFLEEAENRIYVPNTVAVAVAAFQTEASVEMHPELDWSEEDIENPTFLHGVYALYSPDDIENFRIAAAAILPEFWAVEDAGSSFGDIAAPMETLNNLANAVLWVAIGTSILIISLLIILFLRERKKEIGIYLSLGEKKSKVIAQMMIEVLAVSLIAITLALFAGSILSAGISETMLRNDLVAGRGIDEGVSFGILDQMGVVVDMPVDEMLAGYDVSLDTQTIITFYIAAITTIIAATILPMLYIMRMNPKEIML